MKWRTTVESMVSFSEKALAENNATEQKITKDSIRSTHARDVNGLSEILWLLPLCVSPSSPFCLHPAMFLLQPITRLDCTLDNDISIKYYCCLPERKIIKNNGNEPHWQLAFPFFCLDSLTMPQHGKGMEKMFTAFAFGFDSDKNRAEWKIKAERKVFLSRLEVRIELLEKS